jgi:hypothetical protein
LPGFSNGNMSRPVQVPCGKFLGGDVQVYCSGRNNLLDDSGAFLGSRWAQAASVDLGWPLDFDSKINGPGVHLTRDLISGANSLRGVDGTIFVTGRTRKNGEPLSSRQRAGILAFIWDHTETEDPDTRGG